jgi:hypothetical protein
MKEIHVLTKYWNSPGNLYTNKQTPILLIYVLYHQIHTTFLFFSISVKGFRSLLIVNSTQSILLALLSFSMIKHLVSITYAWWNKFIYKSMKIICWKCYFLFQWNFQWNSEFKDMHGYIFNPLPALPKGWTLCLSSGDFLDISLLSVLWRFSEHISSA